MSVSSPTLPSFPVQEELVDEAVWDDGALACLDRMKGMLLERTLPRVEMRRQWSTLYRLSKFSTERERYMMYVAAHEVVVKSDFTLLDYIILMAMLELKNVLSPEELSVIHRLIREILKEHQEIGHKFGRDEPRFHLPTRRYTSLLVDPLDQARG